MKTNGLKMSFGFSAVNNGQRNVVLEPQFIATSCEGGFRMTPPVSKALGIAHGDNVMFLSNVDTIDQAIVAKDPTIVEFCEANGLELGSVEAMIAIHTEFDTWAIAKGIVEYDTKGNMKTVCERLSKDDKIKFVNQNFDEMLTAAMTDASDDVKASLSREGISKDEQVSILSAFVTPRELPKYKGSKAANAAGLTGTGISLTFTDSNIWKQMKHNMGDEAKTLNRVFDVNLDELQDIEIHNGYEMVTVKALVLGDYTDKAPSRIVKK